MVFVVFLHYVPQLRLYMDDGERYFGRWGLGDVARIAAGTLLLAGAALGLDWLIRRWAPAWATRLYHHLFLVALLSGALAALLGVEKHPTVVATCWWAGLAVIAASLVWKRSRLVHYAAVACLVFSPLLPILFAEMLLWPRWSDESLDPLPAAAQDNEQGPSVFIFVFDEVVLAKEQSRRPIHGRFPPRAEVDAKRRRSTATPARPSGRRRSRCPASSFRPIGS